MKMTVPVVAIDGPVGVGKSSVARKVARVLQFQYLDTGAMYRSVIWKARTSAGGDDFSNDDLIATAHDLQVSFQPDGSVFWGSDNISLEIRSEEVSRLVYRAADLPEVRKALVTRQQQLGAKTPSVLEGRDITTVVFPDARWKFYLDASPTIRAKRRWEQLKEGGHNSQFQRIFADLLERDNRDRNREVGGLKIAEGSVVLDTSGLTEEAVVSLIVAFVKAG